MAILLCVLNELCSALDKQIDMINAMQANIFLKHIIRHANLNLAVKNRYFLSRLSSYSGIFPRKNAYHLN